MIVQPKHNRKLGICGVALTKVRNNRHETQALREVREEIEQLMIKSGYLADAPFSWVTLSIRYGLKNDEEPLFQRINVKYGDLPLAIEVDTHQLLGVPLDTVKSIFRLAVLKALIHAGIKYQRPIDLLRDEFRKMSPLAEGTCPDKA